jgi:hypothetical protein
MIEPLKYLETIAVIEEILTEGHSPLKFWQMTIVNTTSRILEVESPIIILSMNFFVIIFCVYGKFLHQI